MLGKFLLSSVVVLLLSSTTLAGIDQTQGFTVGAFNTAVRTGCVGSAAGKNMVEVGHAQSAYDAWRGTTTRQKETATLSQSASVVGSGGAQVVVQRASAAGTQSQLVAQPRFRPGGFGKRSARQPLQQTVGQTLSVGLDTSISHVGAVGRVAGAQSFVGTQRQTEITPNGISTGYQSVRAAQSATVSGGPSSVVKVNNGLDATLSQNRNVTSGF
jgi:hypothetical protein